MGVESGHVRGSGRGTGPIGRQERAGAPELAPTRASFFASRSTPAGHALAADRIAGRSAERGDAPTRGLDLRRIVAAQEVVVLLTGRVRAHDREAAPRRRAPMPGARRQHEDVSGHHVEGAAWGPPSSSVAVPAIPPRTSCDVEWKWWKSKTPSTHDPRQPRPAKSARTAAASPRAAGSTS